MCKLVFLDVGRGVRFMKSHQSVYLQYLHFSIHVLDLNKKFYLQITPKKYTHAQSYMRLHVYVEIYEHMCVSICMLWVQPNIKLHVKTPLCYSQTANLLNSPQIFKVIGIKA